MAKTEVFRVRVNKAERSALDAEAEKLGVKPSSLIRSGIRQMLAAPDLMEEERTALHDGFRVLRGAANNLNQLTRWVNQGRSGLEPSVAQEMIDLRSAVENLRSQFASYLCAEKDRQVALTAIDSDRSS